MAQPCCQRLGVGIGTAFQIRGNVVKINYIQKVTKRQTKYGPRTYGPYWYAFWRAGPKVKCKYVGEHLPPSVHKAVREGFATVRYLPADLDGQQTFAFDAEELKEKHGYFPRQIPAAVTREKARKIYFWAKQGKRVTDYGRTLYDRDFGQLCIDRGWRRPLKDRSKPATAGEVNGQCEAARPSAL